MTRTPDTSRASTSLPFWTSCHPASKINCGAGKTSADNSPVALSSCQITTSNTGDNSLMMFRRWAPQTWPTVDVAAASATVRTGLLTIATTVADRSTRLKSLTPGEGKRQLVSRSDQR